MKETVEIQNINGLSDLLFEIILRCTRRGRGFDEQFNDLVSLILTGEQLRDQLCEYRGEYVFWCAKLYLQSYEEFLADVSLELSGALRDDLENAVAENAIAGCEDDEEEFCYLRRGLDVIRKGHIEKFAKRLSRKS
jgi:hypothetical protein